MLKKEIKTMSRYKRDNGDDDEDDGQAAAMLAATLTMGRSLVCMIFALPDEETTPEDVIEEKKVEREAVIAKLRALNLDIDQLVNQAGDKLLLTLSLPEERILEEAQQQGIMVRLNEEKYGGAKYPFKRGMYEMEAYAKTSDECEACLALSSLQLLELTHSIVIMEPFDDGSGDSSAIDPSKLVDDGVILAYFYLHYDRTRLKLLESWVLNWGSPQPLEEIKEYFGEKIALFCTWLGFYNTMLWLPALWGLLVSGAKVYFNASDHPWVALYGVLMVVWAVLVSHLWKRLEATRRYEWDTLEFEEQEVMRIEFMKSKSTVRNQHKNETTGQIDEYYFDEGTMFPPSGRASRSMVTFGVIFVMNALSILLTAFIYLYLVHPLLTKDDVLMGSFVGGVMFSSLSIILDRLFALLVTRLIENENWMTETQHEDALIIRTFVFNVVNKYFCFIFIAFIVNHVKIMGRNLCCPDWQCMPVVHYVLMVHFCATVVLNSVEANVVPLVMNLIQDYINHAALKKAVGKSSGKTPMEAQMEMAEYPGVFDKYSHYVFQFGYISCFCVAFPLGTAIALAINLYQMRMDAKKLITATQRPPYACASDIGSWQSIMEIIASAAVISNSLIIGVTSHSIYFYFPQMTMLQRIWGVILLEHFLFCVKIFIENLIKIDTDRAQKEYARRVDMMEYHLRETFKDVK